MKLLTARKVGTDLHYSVHLDETKMLDGQPDPDWVLTATFGVPTQGKGETAANFAARLKSQEADALRDLKALAMEARNRKQPAETVLAAEGTSL